MGENKISQWVRREWRIVRSWEPGRRFVRTHERSRPAGGPRAFWVRPLVLLVATVLFLIGLVLAVMPGPAVLFYALAAVLVATQYRWAAHWLDRGELRGRRWWGRISGRWRRWRDSRG